MALIACPECNKQVSDQAPACPHCGFPISRPASKPNGAVQLMNCPDCNNGWVQSACGCC